jgi:hypothetical protein
VLSHVPQVANVLRGEAVDFGKIDRSAKSEAQNPLSEFEQFVRGNGEEVALGVKGEGGLPTLRGCGAGCELMFIRC